MRGDRIAGLFGFVFAIYILIQSVKLDLGGVHQPGPGFFSFFGGTLLAVFSLILLIQSVLTRGKGAGKKTEGGKENPRAVVFCVIAIVVFGLILETLGFVVCTFLLVILLLWLFDRRKWWAVLFTAGCVSLGIYVVFNVLLKSDLPVGILENLL